MAIIDAFGIETELGGSYLVHTDTCRFELPLIIYCYLRKEGIKKKRLKA